MSQRATESIESRVKGLVALAAIISAPDLRMGEVITPSASAAGPLELPYYSLSKAARAFIDQCYELELVLADFDRTQWVQSPEARQLHHSRQALAHASAEQVAKLLTVLIRQERFSEGSLDEAHKSGLLPALLERVVAIAASAGDTTEA
jgi:hypothetical protein